MGLISGMVMGIVVGIALMAGWKYMMGHRSSKRVAKVYRFLFLVLIDFFVFYGYCGVKYLLIFFIFYF